MWPEIINFNCTEEDNSSQLELDICGESAVQTDLTPEYVGSYLTVGEAGAWAWETFKFSAVSPVKHSKWPTKGAFLHRISRLCYFTSVLIMIILDRTGCE